MQTAPLALSYSRNSFPLLRFLTTGRRTKSSSSSRLVRNPSSEIPAIVAMAATDLRLYNSMTQQKEVFKPREQGKVGMYVCGITAYDFSHLGHARAAVSFDVLFRYLLHLGHEVNYVRNFTDVDDKIIRRANELGVEPLSLSSKFCDEFLRDMDDLRCLRPTHQPRVSDHLDQIQNMITQIIENGNAYIIDGDVYFSVDKLPNYGRLSRQKVEDNRAGERVAVDTRKRNPADFALWKRAKPDEPSWESPWGRGRPGWHIECSAMSARFLSFNFDIHGGGIDLIFPHHENEIAQSYAVCHESNVGYWMHNGHVTNNNEKMSKSLGNFFTIREITKLYHPLALRHFLLSAHYRSHLNYTVLQLESASDSVYYIYQTLIDCESVISSFKDELKNKLPNGKNISTSPSAKECIDKLHMDFESKMSDDLLTPPVLNGSLIDTLRFMNNSLKLLKKTKQKQQQLSVLVSLAELEKEVRKVLQVLGLLSSPFSQVVGELKEKALERAGVKEEEVTKLIEERKELRKNKEYKKGDEIRKNLCDKGIMLMDEESNLTSWRPRTILDHLS